jgi:hypothetical protein
VQGREGQQIVSALVIAFSMVVVQVLVGRPLQREFSKEDELG